MKKKKTITASKRKNSSQPDGQNQRRFGRRATKLDYGYRGLDRNEAIQRYVDLYEFALVPYVSFDRTGRIEEINLAAVQLLGRSRDFLLGRPFAIYVAREEASLFLNHLLRCRSNERHVETELRLKTARGELVHVYLSSTPITSSMRDGAILFQTAIVDLTERKHAEEKLRDSQRRLDAALSTACMAAWEWDPENDCITASDNISEIFGLYPSQKLESGSFGLSLVHPDDVQRRRKLVQRAGEQGKSWHDEFCIIRPCDRRIAWLEERATATRDAETGKPRFTGMVWDITKRKQAEEALRESEIKLARELEDTKQLHAISSRLVEEDK